MFRSHVFRSQVFRSKFRSELRSQWISGVAAAAYVLALPATGIPALAGQSKSNPPPSTENAMSPVNAQPVPPKVVVVVTGTLDLGKITIADFGDIEPAR